MILLYSISIILWVGQVSSICIPIPVVEGNMTITDSDYAVVMQNCMGFDEKKCPKQSCKWVKFWESGQLWTENKKASDHYNELLKEDGINIWDISVNWKSPWDYPDAKKAKLDPRKEKQWNKMSKKQKDHVLKYDLYPPIAYPSIAAEAALKKKVEKKGGIRKLEELLMDEGFIEIAFENEYKDAKKKDEITKSTELITVYDVDPKSIPNAVATSELITKEKLLLSMDYDVKQKKLWKINEGKKEKKEKHKEAKGIDSKKLAHAINSHKSTQMIHKKHGIHDDRDRNHNHMIPVVHRRLLLFDDDLGAVPTRRRLLFGRDIRLPVRNGAGAGFANDHTQYTGVGAGGANYPVDNTMAPFNSIGAIHIWDGNNWKIHCTAWPLTPRIIVTNAHCIVVYAGLSDITNRPQYNWFPIKSFRFRPGWTGTAAAHDPIIPIYADDNAYVNDIQTPNGAAHGIKGEARWYIGNGANANDRAVPGDRMFSLTFQQQIAQGGSAAVDQGNGNGNGGDNPPNAQCNYGYPGTTPQNCRRKTMMHDYRPDDILRIWIGKGWMEPPGGWTYNVLGRATNNLNSRNQYDANRAIHVHDYAIIKLRNDRAINLANHPALQLSRVQVDPNHLNSADPQYYQAPQLQATGLGDGDAGTYTGLFTSGYPGIWAYNQMTNLVDGNGGGQHGSYVHDREPNNRLWSMHDALYNGASGSPYIQLNAGANIRAFGLHAFGDVNNGAHYARGLEIDQPRYNTICAKANADTANTCPLVVGNGGVVQETVHQWAAATESEENIYDDGEYEYKNSDGYEDEYENDDEDEYEDVVYHNYYNHKYYQHVNDKLVFCILFISMIIFLCICTVFYGAVGIGFGYYFKTFAKKINI